MRISDGSSDVCSSDLVGGHQSEAHVGCLLAVAREPRREPFRGQVARHRDRQRLRRLARLHRAHRFLELQETLPPDRKRVVEGKSESVSGDIGCRRNLNKNKTTTTTLKIMTIQF